MACLLHLESLGGRCVQIVWLKRLRECLALVLPFFFVFGGRSINSEQRLPSIDDSWCVEGTPLFLGIRRFVSFKPINGRQPGTVTCVPAYELPALLHMLHV
jgi:hypothetical protein